YAVEGFGSSESSPLEIGDGASLTVPGLTIADLLAHAGADPVFVKIDIEGYEYRIIREIAKLKDNRVRGLQCALHPGLYERSLAGPWLWRRLRTLAATLHFGAMFAGRFDGPFILGFPSFAAYLVRGVLLRKTPKGKDLLFLRGTKARSPFAPGSLGVGT
ncbi:MAG: FkbM family methyltransferase, partial [Pseudomonadota bacterium]|nr:FkbM family methyltransferase [Pseudomonadota bacterium]